jgi:hypothetical protein
MKDVRFYLEFPSHAAKKRSGKRNVGHSGNVFAAFNNPPNFVNGTIEGLGSVFDYPNSPVACTAAAPDVMRGLYKRIPEGLARKIHPALFERLDKE